MDIFGRLYSPKTSPAEEGKEIAIQTNKWVATRKRQRSFSRLSALAKSEEILDRELPYATEEFRLRVEKIKEQIKMGMKKEVETIRDCLEMELNQKQDLQD